MRIFIAILILINSLNSFTKADDVRDFEIEGIGISLSLLDFFTKDQIEKEKNSEFTFVYKNNKFMKIGMGEGEGFYLQKNISIYDDIGIIIKPNDHDYIVYGVQGRIFCDEGINYCLSKQEEIILDLKKIFSSKSSIDKYEDKHSADKTGKSIVYINDFIFKHTEDIIGVTVTDWSEEMTSKKKWYDNLKVDIFSSEYVNFLRNEAFN